MRTVVCVIPAPRPLHPDTLSRGERRGDSHLQRCHTPTLHHPLVYQPSPSSVCGGTATATHKYQLPFAIFTTTTKNPRAKFRTVHFAQEVPLWILSSVFAAIAQLTFWREMYPRPLPKAMGQEAKGVIVLYRVPPCAVSARLVPFPAARC